MAAMTSHVMPFSGEHGSSGEAHATRVTSPVCHAAVSASTPPASPPTIFFLLGAAVSSLLHSSMQVLLGETPDAAPTRSQGAPYESASLPDPFGPDVPPLPPRPPLPDMSHVSHDIVPDAESVEWVNMCVRKVWRVYQRGLEKWIADLLQPVFDTYINEETQPAILKRIRIAQFTLTHEPPVFNEMQRRNSRKESDINGVFAVRYCGGAQMILILELGGRLDGVEIPVRVHDFDLDAKMWIKLRLAPMCPWVGVVSLAFVEPPRIQVQLNPYGMLPLMRIPVLQRFLKKLLTEELPSVMVLPQRLEINLPPSVTVLAEAAVGRDTVMRAVASAVLQADAMEQALFTALPLDAENVVTRVSVPEAFVGELTVTLVRGRDLPVWGFPWQSNPFCRLELGTQAVESKRDRETGGRGAFKHPTWQQDFQFLVEDPNSQELRITIYDSPYTGRSEVGTTKLRLADLPDNGTMKAWLPVRAWDDDASASSAEKPGALRMYATFRAFDDLDGSDDSGARLVAAEGAGSSGSTRPPLITDVQSAAAASAQGAVESSRALEALSVARAAAARAAARMSAPAAGRSGARGAQAPRSAGYESSGSDGETAVDAAMVPLAQLAELGRVREDQAYMDQLVNASRKMREDALADTLSKRAVTRITDKETPPASASQIRKGLAMKQAQQQAGGNGAPLPRAARGNSAGGAAARRVASEREVDYAFQGDGATTSVADVEGQRLRNALDAERDRIARSLRPNSALAGETLEELMGREATVRIREDAHAAQQEETLRSRGSRSGSQGDAVPAASQRPADKDAVAPPASDASASSSKALREQATQTDRQPLAVVARRVRGVDTPTDLPEVGRASVHVVGDDGSGLSVPSTSDSSSLSQGVVASRPSGGSRAGKGRGRRQGSAEGSAAAGAFRQRRDLLRTVEELVKQDTTRPNGSGSETGAAVTSTPSSDDVLRRGAANEGVEGGSAAAAAEPDDESASPWWAFWDRRPQEEGGKGADRGTVDMPPPAASVRNDDREAASVDAEVQAEEPDRSLFRWFSALPWPKPRAAHDTDSYGSIERPASRDPASGASGSAEEGVQVDAGEGESRPGLQRRGLGGWWSSVVDATTSWARGEGGASEDKAETVRGGRDATTSTRKTAGPVETIIVSPEVPIEEIAAEIVRVKAQQSSESEERARKEVDDLLAGPMRRLRKLGEQLERLNKPEVVLLCALFGGAMVLLAVVALRLELWVEYRRIVEELKQAGII